MRELLSAIGDRRVDPNEKKGLPLIHACRYGHKEVVQLLLSLSGARAVSPHWRHGHAFIVACRHGHADIVRMLLELNGERTIDVHAQQNRAFVDACSAGHLAVVRELLALQGDRCINVNQNGEQAFLRACKSNQIEIVCELLALRGSRTVDVAVGGSNALRQACKAGHAGLVRVLLDHHGDKQVDANANDGAPLRNACRYGHVAVLRELLQHPATDVQLLDAFAFREACRYGQLEIVREMLQLTGPHCLPEHVFHQVGFSRGMTPLNGAGKHNQVSVVRELLGLEGSRCAPSSTITSAFSFACQDSSVGALQELLRVQHRFEPSAEVFFKYQRRNFQFGRQTAHVRKLLSLLEASKDADLPPTAALCQSRLLQSVATLGWQPAALESQLCSSIYSQLCYKWDAKNGSSLQLLLWSIAFIIRCAVLPCTGHTSLRSLLIAERTPQNVHEPSHTEGDAADQSDPMIARTLSLLNDVAAVVSWQVWHGVQVPILASGQPSIAARADSAQHASIQPSALPCCFRRMGRKHALLKREHVRRGAAAAKAAWQADQGTSRGQ